MCWEHVIGTDIEEQFFLWLFGHGGKIAVEAFSLEQMAREGSLEDAPALATGVVLPSSGYR